MIKECMVKALQESWTALKDELFENLNKSIQKRMKIIIKNKR